MACGTGCNVHPEHGAIRRSATFEVRVFIGGRWQRFGPVFYTNDVARKFHSKLLKQPRFNEDNCLLWKCFSIPWQETIFLRFPIRSCTKFGMHIYIYVFIYMGKWFHIKLQCGMHIYIYNLYIGKLVVCWGQGYSSWMTPKEWTATGHIIII